MDGGSRPPRESPGARPRPGALDQQAIARELLPASDPGLRRWATRKTWRPALSLLRCYAFFVAAFALLSLHQAPWAYVLAFFIIGTQQYALFILAHDAMHANLVRDKRLNDFLSDLLLFAPLGMSLRDQRPNHLDHHWLFGSEADPDRYLHASGNKSTRGAFVFFLSGLKTFPRTILKVSPFGAREEGEFFTKLGRALARRAPMLLVQALILFAISRILPWWYYLVFGVLPVYALVFVPGPAISPARARVSWTWDAGTAVT